ncbi:histidine phosphatase family protein [Paenibacillus sp. KS-LC4]|uniref:histidine phosphatase family protein n=1 Tax=Paenibacillus sp. KS-LC4 TaxID=2979727 RepID=UPI0030D1BE09
MRIIMIRHAEASCNILHDASLIEAYDPLCELTELGVKQAMLLRERFPSTLTPTIMFTSPYKRALETANIFRQRFPVALSHDERLGEVRAPSRFDPPITQLQWDMLLHERFRSPDQEVIRDLESLKSQRERVVGFCQELLDQYGHDSTANVIVFTHAFCIQLALLHFMKLDNDNLLQWQFKMSNTGMHMIKYEHDAGTFLIESINNKIHLEQI